VLFIVTLGKLTVEEIVRPVTGPDGRVTLMRQLVISQPIVIQPSDNSALDISNAQEITSRNKAVADDINSTDACLSPSMFLQNTPLNTTYTDELSENVSDSILPDSMLPNSMLLDSMLPDSMLHDSAVKSDSCQLLQAIFPKSEVHKQYEDQVIKEDQPHLQTTTCTADQQQLAVAPDLCLESCDNCLTNICELTLPSLSSNVCSQIKFEGLVSDLHQPDWGPVVGGEGGVEDCELCSLSSLPSSFQAFSPDMILSSPDLNYVILGDSDINNGDII